MNDRDFSIASGRQGAGSTRQCLDGLEGVSAVRCKYSTERPECNRGHEPEEKKLDREIREVTRKKRMARKPVGSEDAKQRKTMGQGRRGLTAKYANRRERRREPGSLLGFRTRSREKP
jgi:hypothetical protein